MDDDTYTSYPHNLIDQNISRSGNIITTTQSYHLDKYDFDTSVQSIDCVSYRDDDLEDLFGDEHIFHLERGDGSDNQQALLEMFRHQDYTGAVQILDAGLLDTLSGATLPFDSGVYRPGGRYLSFWVEDPGIRALSYDSLYDNISHHKVWSDGAIIFREIFSLAIPTPDTPEEHLLQLYLYHCSQYPHDVSCYIVTESIMAGESPREELSDFMEM